MPNINVQDVIDDVQKYYGDDDLIGKVIKHVIGDFDENLLECDDDEREDFINEVIPQYIDDALWDHNVDLEDEVYEGYGDFEDRLFVLREYIEANVRESL